MSGPLFANQTHLSPAASSGAARVAYTSVNRAALKATALPNITNSDFEIVSLSESF